MKETIFYREIWHGSTAVDLAEYGLSPADSFPGGVFNPENSIWKGPVSALKNLRGKNIFSEQFFISGYHETTRATIEDIYPKLRNLRIVD